MGLMNFKGFIIEIWLFLCDQTSFGVWYFEIQVTFFSTIAYTSKQFAF